jgi:UDP-glucose 4-epimerase
MRSLVTGGAGFIGSHIVDRLVDMGHEVVVIDDQSAICHEKFYFNHRATYCGLPVYSDYVSHLFEKIDYVFHLAAESRIQPTLDNPELAIKTNVLGTCRVLQHALNHDVKKVIYSSTSSAYGLSGILPLVETMKKDCLNPYSITKTAGEEFCKIYTRLYNLDTVTFRYFNVYGERQPTKGQYAPVVGLFQRQSAAGEPMTIVGDGNQTRDYTHVSDVVEANIAAMESTNKLISGEIFNIGTGNSYSVNDIANIIGGETTFIPPRKGEARHTLADISKAERFLNWKPKVKLEEWLNGK